MPDETHDQPSPRRARCGRILSWLFHPFVLGLPALIAIGVVRQGLHWSLMPAVALAVLVIIGGPTLGTVVLMRLRLVDDLFVSVRRQRIYLYPLLLVCFLGGGLILLRAGVDSLVVAILLSATVSLILAGILTLWIKLSLHCAGMAGVAVGLAVAFGPRWWLTLLLLVPTAIGRMWARGHTLREVVVGSLYGTAATWALVKALALSGWLSSTTAAAGPPLHPLGDAALEPEASASAASPGSASTPPAPSPAVPLASVALPEKAPRCRRIMRRTRLSYDPALDAVGRRADLLDKTQQALAMMGVKSLAAIRTEAVQTLEQADQPWSWGALSQLRTRDGQQSAVKVTVRVWVPQGARRIASFVGSQPAWVTAPDDNLAVASNDFWFSERLADVNDRQHYRPATLTFDTYVLHAPIAFLLFDHVFREGYYDLARRVPIMAIRSGEDCYSADRSTGPIRAEAADFITEDFADFRYQVKRHRYRSAGDLMRGCHVQRSNHRIGCALDVNNFSLFLSNDGATNAVTASPRHADRDRIHAIDARNLPAWLYDAAKSMGYRVPQDWSYDGNRRDWTHIDLGRGSLIGE